MMVIGKIVVVNSLCVSLSILFISCSKPLSEPLFSSSDLSGKWMVKKVHARGTATVSTANWEIDTVITLSDERSAMTLYADETYSMRLDPASLKEYVDIRMFKSQAAEKEEITIKGIYTDTGTWTKSGGQLIMQSISQDTVLSLPFSLNGDSLTMAWNVTMDIEPFGLSMSMNDDSFLDFIRRF